jgi:soluble lytic murein transglycosylase-like protein
MAVHTIRMTLLLAFCLPLAGESVVLKNGFRIHADRHEIEGDNVRLYMDGGSAVMTVAEIERYEAEEAVAKPTPSASAPAPADKQAVPNIDENIRAAGAKYGLDPDFIRSIIAAESAGNPKAVSPKGAGGLMQLMPGTAKALGVNNVFDSAANVDGGTAYIRQLLDRYDHDVVLALAAYNAGPGKVDNYGGLPPYRETNAYVTRIIKKFNSSKEKTKN